MSGLLRVMRGILPGAAKKRTRAGLERLQARSLRAALHEQDLWELQAQLARIVPDLKKQYSSFDLDSEYLFLKARGLHAFQTALASHAVQSMCLPTERPTIVDIGDSAGTHIQYLQELHKTQGLTCVSINLDEEAVRKIRGKGLQAVHVRAEDLATQGINADIFVSFEMVEHLPNPIRFLKNLADHTTCRALVVTVPYVARSRVGLHHIRDGRRQTCSPENTHIFELCPADWRLLFMHAGWSITYDRVYLQYPKWSMFRLMKPIWRTLDFEGFWGAILRRDATWSSLYVGGE